MVQFSPAPIRRVEQASALVVAHGLNTDVPLTRETRNCQR